MIVIIGAGTAGLTARREVARKTDDYILVDSGPMGTTCARIGCMPSKAFIQVANDFHRRKKFEQVGINGADTLSVDFKKVMTHTRQLRDRFTGGVLKGHEAFQDKIVRKHARFIDQETVDLEGEKVKFTKTIIATGSSPIIPQPWTPYKSHLLTTDEFFELETIPKKMAVIGLGVIGLELGQALHRLGVDVVGIGRDQGLGGLSSPKILELAKATLSDEMTISWGDAEIMGISDDNLLHIKVGDQDHYVERALVAVGRSPNIKNLNLQALNVKLDPRGLPEIDLSTFSLIEASHIYLVGDANNTRPILHEASDQGFVAGQAAITDNDSCFQQRTPLAITFCEPNIATCGRSYRNLIDSKVSFVTGAINFQSQGRALTKLSNNGMLEVYVETNTGELLGAELFCPNGEHLAHLLAWAISSKQTVFDLLMMPFYHPVLEEGLRTALREAARQVEGRREELNRCAENRPGDMN